MLQPETPQKLIEKAKKLLLEAGFDSPRREAEALLCGALRFTRAQIYSQGAQPLEYRQVSRFNTWLERRLNREPLSYICGKREFWSLDFHVNQEVLIPRPETECLVEACLEHIPSTCVQNILEIGTGSGVISTVLALERPHAIITATDLSKKALSIARKNLNEHLEGQEVSLLFGDLFEPISADNTFDFIVSNPPYIPDSALPELDPDVFQYEPTLALAGGNDGLDIIRKICQEAPAFLRKNGLLCLEFGADQEDAIREILKKNHFKSACFGKDYAGLYRFVLSSCCADSSSLTVQSRFPMEPL